MWMPSSASTSRPSAGSKLCYSFVLTSVEEAEETTSSMRERGKIDERTYCFYLTTVFVPQNEYALGWSMAGNTGDYTGEDPPSPKARWNTTAAVTSPWKTTAGMAGWLGPDGRPQDIPHRPARHLQTI